MSLEFVNSQYLPYGAGIVSTATNRNSVDTDSESDHEPIALSFITDEERAGDHKEEPLDDSQAIITKGYIANAGATLSISALQALVNRILNNNGIHSEKNEGSWTIMMDMTFAHFSNKMVKGNWAAVDSEKKQILVLISYVCAAALFDTGASFLPIGQSQSFPLGQATIIAGVNALGYASAMASAAILQKHTYTIQNKLDDPDKERSSLNVRRFASGALLGGIAMGAAASNRLLVSTGSAFGVVLNIANNEVVNKIFKTGQGTEDSTAKKIALLGFYAIMATASDCIIGLALPSSLPYSSPSRYFGGTTMGATISFLKVSAKALLDHDRIDTAKKGKTEEVVDFEALEKKKRSAKWKAIGACAATVAVPALTILANHSNYLAQTSMLSLGIKLVQHNLTALAAQEMFKATTSVFWRAVGALAPVGVALAGELVANYIDPSRAGFAVTGVAVATAASYLGMTTSAYMVGGDGDGD
jgi:hypothetical protein